MGKYLRLQPQKRPRKGKTFKCETCGKEFYLCPSDIRRSEKNGSKVRFCSMKCYDKSGSRNPFHGRNHSEDAKKGWKKNADRNRFKNGKDNPNFERFGKESGYVGQSMAWWKKKLMTEVGYCEICGFSDKRALSLHHKNKNRKDNDRDNIILLCWNCHQIEHFNDRSGLYKFLTVDKQQQILMENSPFISKEAKTAIKKGSLKLDIGCGQQKQSGGYIGMDIRKVKGVDIVHDAEVTPYPLPKECCSAVVISHLIEHLCPKKIYRVMDELWRIMQPEGHLFISMPYAGSQGFWQDPSHCHSWNEATVYYFDPYPASLKSQRSALYDIYKPKPWKTLQNDWVTGGNIQIILEKRMEDSNA